MFAICKIFIVSLNHSLIYSVTFPWHSHSLMNHHYFWHHRWNCRVARQYLYMFGSQSNALWDVSSSRKVCMSSTPLREFVASHSEYISLTEDGLQTRPQLDLGLFAQSDALTFDLLHCHNFIRFETWFCSCLIPTLYLPRCPQPANTTKLFESHQTTPQIKFTRHVQPVSTIV